MASRTRARCVIRLKIRARGDDDGVVEDDGEVDDVVLGLVFTHTERYPDEAPEGMVGLRGLRTGNWRRYSEEW